MAAARNDALLDSELRSCRSGVNIQFVDEDELPLAHLTEHRVSEDEFLAYDEHDKDEEMDEAVEKNDWSEEINRREDVEFQEQVGITVDSDLAFISFCCSSLNRYGSC